MDKLKKCPFCGSNELENTGHEILCECGASGAGIYSVPNRQQALDSWNKRPETGLAKLKTCLDVDNKKILPRSVIEEWVEGLLKEEE